jgi:hypothetical protein
MWVSGRGCGYRSRSAPTLEIEGELWVHIRVPPVRRGANPLFAGVFWATSVPVGLPVDRSHAAPVQVPDLAAATLQAAVRRAVELQLLTEQFRADMLAGGKLDAEQMVRVENMLNRAERHVAELIAKLPKPPEWWERDDEENDDGTQG